MCASSNSNSNQGASAGSSSESRLINIDNVLSQTCLICYDNSVKKTEKFVTDCFHAFCVECFTNFIISNINAKTYPILCPVPSCRHHLSPYDCLSLLEDSGRKDENEQLSILIIEYEIKENIRYCANKKCSTPFEWKADQSDQNGSDCNRAVCPACRHASCVQCREPWHVGMNCEEYKREQKRLNVNRLNDLAEKMGWKNCPHCNHLVEKIWGCNVMYCHCRKSWDYVYRSKVERDKNFRMS